MELFLIWIVGAVAVAIIAGRRGRDGIRWFALAALISPLLAGILVFLLPSRIEGATAASIERGTGKKCPACAEVVRIEALKCRFCGSALSAETSPNSVDWTKRDSSHVYALMIATAFGLLGLILLFVTM